MASSPGASAPPVPAITMPGGDRDRAARTNLPAQLTSFVGREEESRRVGKLLRETRLVTLTGPGGAGKTRLAGESAAPFVDELPDGVWFVPLAPVSDPVDVVPAVVAALGVPDTVRPGETRTAARPLDRLIDFLAGKQMIIVLDNCEHLIDTVAGLVDRTLGLAPGVRVLATSREPLGITGESLCPVPSLPLPPPDEHDDPGPDPAEALGYAAVRLFADRAAAVRPGFAVDDETAPDVIAICRALDGIPLAIELAAARLRSLTPGQVAARLGDRFRLLTGGSRTALPRHRTLRAVVDWSWDLLDDVERTVLRRLSVFAGGATPESAVRVCGLDAPDAPDPHDVIDVIAALIDKSLVMAEGDPDVRYRLLETVRVYAGERLEEAGEAPRVRAEHAAYCVWLAERAEPELRRGDQLRWLDRLSAERDNFTAAFRHIADTGDAETGLRLVGALVWFWLMRDLEIEAGGWSVAIRDILGPEPPPGLAEQYALCKISAELITLVTADDGTTAEHLRESLDRATALVPEAPRHPVLVLMRPASRVFTGDMEGTRQALVEIAGHPDPWIRAVVHVMLAFIALNTGQVDEAATEAATGQDAFRELGDRFGELISLSALMQVAMARGELTQAVRLGEQAYRYAVEGVNPEQGASMLVQLARARAQLGDVERARRELHQAIAASERVGDFADAASASLMLCELAMADGDLAAARPYAERAYDWVEPRRHRPDFQQATRRTYSRLGCLAEQGGDLDEATRWHLRAFDGVENDALSGNPTLAALVEGIAALRAARGDGVRAAELLGIAHGLHGFRDNGSHEVRRTVAAATAALGEDAFAAAYDRGRHVPRDAMIAEAASLIEPT